MSGPHVAVNGRFLLRPVTGVERYGRELLPRLEGTDGEVTVIRPTASATGLRGHAWEQSILPRRYHQSGADVLVSLANTGPVTVSRQIVVIHDVAPFLVPQRFSRAYRTQIRWLQRALAARATIATVSEHSRRDVAHVLHLDPAALPIVPPAVGAPFTDDVERPRERRAVLVGGHDPRKNVGFLLDLWSDVHRRTGLELHVAARSGSDSFPAQARTSPVGVVWRWDLDDTTLADLYRSAIMVLMPSDYEGFGFPLLEGAACRTPFLAADTGAARELAVDPERQLLPLDRRAWIDGIARMADSQDADRLRAAAREHARAWNWESSARLLRDVITDVGSRT